MTTTTSDMLPQMNGHDVSLDSLKESLKTDLDKGLTSEEAKNRIETIGPNSIPVVKGSLWQVYLAPMLEVMIVVYLIMAGILIVLALFTTIITAIIGSLTFEPWLQAGQWLIIVAVNFAIAIFQQWRGQKKMDALQKMSAAIYDLPKI